MLFNFLKYLQPTHYFQLYRNDGTSVFPIVDRLPEEILQQLQPEINFKSEKAKEYDLSWQAIQKGYIGTTETYKSFEKLPIVDEYRFLRKYFHPFWVFYVLLLRLFSFKNLFQEISAWNLTRGINRNKYLAYPIEYPTWNLGGSSLINEAPLVSVVIPTLNRYEYLKDVLFDFEKQTYTNFEIIIVDQSQPFRRDFYKDFDLKIIPIPQNEPALWKARNTAIKEASGGIIALSEDDVRIKPDWLENHLRCLDYFNADISAGVFYPEGSSIPTERSFFCVASQFATGNAILYKDIFQKIGLFDRQFEKQRMGDGEFGLRAYLHGFKSISNPYASCIDVKASTGGLRQMGSWDGFRPKKWFGPRPVPSVLYQFRKYYGNRAAKLALLKFLPPSLIPYQFKRSKTGMILGFFLALLLFPLVIFQVVKSWNLASTKLKEGARIEKLKG